MFIEMLKMLFGFLYNVCLVIIFLVLPILLSMFLHFLHCFFFKKMRFPKRLKPSLYRKRNFLVRLLWDFPKRFISDLFTLDRDRYKDTGIIIFEGEQGSGKTIAAVHYIYRQMERYPMALFSANIDIAGQDELLTGLEEVISSNNGVYGQINMIDEIQNWLNSNESKNVPVQFIGEICQQRKQAKQIIGTTQRFNRMAKQLRQETTLLCKPVTILGCLTIVRVYRPNVDSDGVVKKARMFNCYFFVHTDELRNAYDTYSKVKRLNLAGFKPLPEQIGNETSAPRPSA